MLKKILKSIENLSDKDKIVLKNSAGAFIVKGFALVVSLFTMPAYLKFFDNEMALGLWFTVLSVLNWILNFDLGIGNGLRNHLALALAEKRYDDARKYISSAYISISALVVVISAIFWTAFDFVNWNAVFNIEQEIVSPSALNISVKIVFVGIMLQFLFKIISSVLYAMQKSSVNNLLALLTSIITVICVTVIPSASNDKNMIIMAIVHALAVLLPLIVTTVIVFLKRGELSLAPSVKAFRISYAKEILSLGGTFLIVQVFYMFIMSTNDYMITILYSPDAVVDYQIYYKLFSLGSTVFALALTPVWSAVTKALAEKDADWIRVLYKKLCKLAFLATLCEFMIVPFLQLGVNLWLRDEAIQTSIPYALVFAAMGSLLMWNSVLSSIANGLGKLKTQLICFGVGSILKFFIAWALAVVLHSWIGVAIANVIAMGIYCLFEPFSIKKNIKHIKHGGDQNVTFYK